MAFTTSERNLRWRTKYPERHKECFNNWRVKNKEKRNAYMKEWNARSKAADPEKYALRKRAEVIKQKYGITLEQYDKMLLVQGNRCALCDTSPEQTRYGRLDVDHCHKDNKVRGLLCNRCNTALGRLGDTIESIERALLYLKGEL